MIIGLFSIQVALAILVVLTTKMMEHKFQVIETSIELYNNARVYKTQSHIEFVDRIIKAYYKMEDTLKEKVDLEAFLVATLQKERIGSFSYMAIKNLANKTSFLMWAVVLLEVLVISIDQLSLSGTMIILTSISALLTIGVEIFKIIMAVNEKQELILTLMVNYLINILPIEKEKKSKEGSKSTLAIIGEEDSLNLEDTQEQEIKLSSTIESETKTTKDIKDSKITEEQIDNSELTAQDIAKLIKILQ